MDEVTIIGGGLAGVEAAHFLANHRVKVKLYEMRPLVQTGAHHTSLLAELVCSNSLKSNNIDNACGLLKEELRKLDSICIKTADENSVPSGQALSVDRDLFSRKIDEIIRQNPYISVINEEVTTILDGVVIVATGPLTSPALLSNLVSLTGKEHQHFYDASAPLIEKSSLNMDVLYKKDRYDKGDGSYLNAPMSKEQYDKFYNELIKAKKAMRHDFDVPLFEACKPIEEIARSGYDALRFGPMKPKGLWRDKNDRSYAIVQLRKEDNYEKLYNLVGFQTNLTYSEQKRVFSLIPGLENAKFVRYGLMHKNIYLNSPSILNEDLSLKANNKIIIAGQLAGVEGYVESMSMGLLAGVNALFKLRKKPMILPPMETMIGSLFNYLHLGSKNHFQPMNANFQILRNYDKNRKDIIIDDAIRAILKYKEKIDE